jgi:N-acetylglutamate synthase-like GNAT family acetyltransferase
MSMPSPPVRRATIEDLPKLVPLWEAEGLPVIEMEKRFKEFQIIEGSDGSIAGAIGLQIVGLEGHLHSEAFAHPEFADALRALFWERLQVVAQNHGLVRIWTQFATPFWNHSGFSYVAGDVASKLPPAFGQGAAPWRFVRLRPDPPSVSSIDKEFAMFKEIENERTARLLRHAKVMKMIAAVVVMAVFVLVAFWVLAWYRTQAQYR